MAFWRTTDSSVDRKAVMLAIGFVESEALKQQVLDWSIDGVKLQDISYPLTSVASRHALTANIVGT